jgi:hypothetical protein
MGSTPGRLTERAPLDNALQACFSGNPSGRRDSAFTKR